MKFTFRWETTYTTRPRRAWGYVTYSRSGEKVYEAATIDEAARQYLDDRNRAMMRGRSSSRSDKTYSITDENGVQYWDAKLEMIRGRFRPMLHDRMVMAIRGGWPTQEVPDGVPDAKSGAVIRTAVDLGDGLWVSPSHLAKIDIERDGKPYMTGQECLDFWSRYPKGGIWRSRQHYAVIADASDGHSDHGFTSFETVTALQEAGRLGPNSYGGFKSHYSVFDHLPEGTAMPDPVVPMWARVDQTARQLAAVTGMPAVMHHGDALDLIRQNKEVAVCLVDEKATPA